MHAKTTDELLKILNSANTVDELTQFSQMPEIQADSIPFHEYLTGFLEASGMTSSELIQRSQIQRNYGYQILNGSKRPGRDKILALCLTLSMSLAEVQRALTLAKEGILYPKCRRDSVLIFCINKHLSVLETNDLLYNITETILD